jgi:hypothetical protein
MSAISLSTLIEIHLAWKNFDLRRNADKYSDKYSFWGQGQGTPRDCMAVVADREEKQAN